MKASTNACSRLRFFRLSALSLAVLLGGPAFGQGTLTVLQTGGGGPLVSTNFPLTVPAMPGLAVLEFLFGFTTDEMLSPSPEPAPDSVTIWAGEDPARLAQVVRADVTGELWAAPLGSVVLMDDQVMRDPAQYPSTAPVLSQRAVAWNVHVPLVDAFFTGPFNVYVDLFDNGNAAPSAAFISDVRFVIVPEPSVVCLSLAGLGGLWLCIRRRQK